MKLVFTLFSLACKGAIAYTDFDQLAIIIKGGRGRNFALDACSIKFL
jgi:hypothetical protein